MADVISFDEGEDEIGNNGLPATCYFGLSDKSVDGTNPYVKGDTLASSGEITGTGYARMSEAEPAGDGAGTYVFAQKVWDTGAATDWSANVRSVFMATTSNNTGKILCAWNLNPGGGANNLSRANTIQRFTPTLVVGS